MLQKTRWLLFFLVGALCISGTALAEPGVGDTGGRIAAKVQEAIEKGLDPAAYAGITVQNGAVVTNKVSRHAVSPMSALEYAASLGEPYRDVTNRFGEVISLNIGEVIVAGDCVYRVARSGSAFTFLSHTGREVVFQDLVNFGDVTLLYEAPSR